MTDLTKTYNIAVLGAWWQGTDVMGDRDGGMCDITMLLSTVGSHYIESRA